MTSITITGIPELFAKLDRVQAIDTLRPPMQRGVYRLQTFMANYPPQAPTKYVRTGTLGRRWTTKVTQGGDGLVGTIGNNTSYGPWVQSDAFQARMHRGRWQTDADAIRDNERAIVADFERAIQTALG